MGISSLSLTHSERPPRDSLTILPQHLCCLSRSTTVLSIPSRSPKHLDPLPRLQITTRIASSSISLHLLLLYNLSIVPNILLNLCRYPHKVDIPLTPITLLKSTLQLPAPPLQTSPDRHVPPGNNVEPLRHLSLFDRIKTHGLRRPSSARTSLSLLSVLTQLLVIPLIALPGPPILRTMVTHLRGPSPTRLSFLLHLVIVAILTFPSCVAVINLSFVGSSLLVLPRYLLLTYSIPTTPILLIR